MRGRSGLRYAQCPSYSTPPVTVGMAPGFHLLTAKDLPQILRIALQRFSQYAV
jgi:hypothetical protein